MFEEYQSDSIYDLANERKVKLSNIFYNNKITRKLRKTIIL